MSHELVGKTIARVEESSYDEWGQSYGLIVWFTDGSAVRLEPDGYEVDGISLQPTDAATLDADWTANIQSAIETHWDRHEAVLRRVDECIKMATAYHVAVRFGPDGIGEPEGAPADVRRFKQWYENRYGLKGFAKLMRDEYLGAIRDTLHQTSRLTFGGQS